MSKFYRTAIIKFLTKASPFLKHILQKPVVNVRRPHGTATQEMRRYASFIGTSNHKDLLTDTSGSRRYIVINVTAPSTAPRLTTSSFSPSRYWNRCSMTAGFMYQIAILFSSAEYYRGIKCLPCIPNGGMSTKWFGLSRKENKYTVLRTVIGDR